MKRKFQIIKALFCACLAVASVSCGDDADYDVIDNVIYLSNSEGIEKSTTILVDEEGSAVSLLVRSAKPVSEDTEVEVSLNYDYLADYNKLYGTDYQRLPLGFVEFEATRVIIPKGKVSAPPVKVFIKQLDEEMSSAGLTYAVPVGLSARIGQDVPILNSSSNFVIAATPIPYYDVPMFRQGNSLLLKLKENMPLNKWTVEFLVKISNLGTGIGSNRNQIMFNAQEPGSTSKVIFTRFGDAAIPGNIFQVKTMDSQFNGQTKFESNKWYHIALTNDGVTVKLYVNGMLDASMPSKNITYILDKDNVRFCGEKQNDEYMKSYVWASQIRIWDIDRTGDQIRNNMYGVSADSEGLKAYWKLNEGEGKIFQDATGNGHTAVAEEFRNPTLWSLKEKVQVGL